MTEQELDELKVKDFEELLEYKREQAAKSFKEFLDCDKKPRLVKLEFEFMTEAGTIASADKHPDFPEE